MSLCAKRLPPDPYFNSAAVTVCFHNSRPAKSYVRIVITRSFLGPENSSIPKFRVSVTQVPGIRSGLFVSSSIRRPPAVNGLDVNS